MLCGVYRSRMIDAKVWIYGLTDPRTPQVIRYIGATRRMQNRLGQHRSRNTLDGFGDWIRELAAIGLMPCMVALEQCDLAIAQATEQAWIAKYEAGQLFNKHHHRPTLTLESIAHLASEGQLTMNALTMEYARTVLQRTGGNMSQTAKVLGIGRQTLYNMMKRSG